MITREFVRNDPLVFAAYRAHLSGWITEQEMFVALIISLSVSRRAVIDELVKFHSIAPSASAANPQCTSQSS